MFTGLVEATGLLVSKRPRSTGYRVSIRHPLGDLDEGESVSVNGVCLTAVAPGAEAFEADLSVETGRVTTLGNAAEGARLNLERSLRAGDRLGGHLVTGHVDSVVTVRELQTLGESRSVVVSLPDALAPYVATKGSVALDGVSLTVNVVRKDAFEVMLIPHTLKATNLSDLSVGKALNLEVDLVARYVARWMETRRSPEVATADSSSRDALEQALRRSGLM